MPDGTDGRDRARDDIGMKTTRSARRIGLTATMLVAGALAASLGGTTGASADTDGLFVTLKDQGFAPVVLTEGQTASFANLDGTTHQIVSVERTPNGRPLFSSPVLGIGEIAPVAGVEELDDRTDGYRFFCPLHAWMSGTLVVTSAPATR